MAPTAAPIAAARRRQRAVITALPRIARTRRSDALMGRAFAGQTAYTVRVHCTRPVSANFLESAPPQRVHDPALIVSFSLDLALPLQNPYECLYGFGWWHVLPDPDDSPSGRSKNLIDGSIAGNVPFQLGLPIGGIGRRDMAVVGAPVPEAAIDEHGNPLARERYVGPNAPPPTWDMQQEILPEPVASAVRQRPDPDLKEAPRAPEESAAGDRGRPR